MNVGSTEGSRAVPALGRWRRAVLASLLAPCMLAGAWLCFDFGSRIGGAWIGALAALNGAAISGLMLDALVDRLWPPRRSVGD